MVNKKSWNEFRESGLFWWTNMVLHTFGWAIVLEIEEQVRHEKDDENDQRYDGDAHQMSIVPFIGIARHYHGRAHDRDAYDGHDKAVPIALPYGHRRYGDGEDEDDEAISVHVGSFQSNKI